MDEKGKLVNSTDLLMFEFKNTTGGFDLGTPQAGHCLVELAKSFVAAGGYLDKVYYCKLIENQ